MGIPRSHAATPAEVEAFLADSPLGVAVFRAVRAVIDDLGQAELRLAATQVAWHRRRGFAWLWQPRLWLGDRGADVVLSLAATSRLPSPRWKQVVEVRPGLFLHHLEVRSADEVDDEVAGWIRMAHTDAGALGSHS